MANAVQVAKNELFQQLKPCCVTLSQLAIKADSSSKGSKAIRESTAQLLDVLERKCRRKDGVFDEKLADYVFFPLSQVLRQCQKQPGVLAELATKCLGILLEYGWNRMISVELGQQLLLLLIFFAGGGPDTVEISEELKIEAFRSLSFLLQDLRNTPKGSSSLIEVSAMPTLGQCLTTVLDGITEGPSPVVQVEAIKTLRSIWSCIKDQQALSNFLPGTVSALTKCLTPTTKAPRSRKVLVNALQALREVLMTCLGDIVTRNLADIETEGKPARLTKSWLKASASQIKLALANIVKLRSHSHEEVRQELEILCLSLLDECHTSLKESARLLVETALTLSSFDVEDIQLRQTNLKHLATIYPSNAELIKSIIYDWTTSLPRVMQSNDETAKRSALDQLSKAQDLLTGVEMSSGLLDDTIAASLRDSVTALLDMSSAPKRLQETSDNSTSSNSLILDGHRALVKQYPRIVMPHDSQVQTSEGLSSLITKVGSTDSQLQMAGKMLEYIWSASGNQLVSAFWLCFQLLKAAGSSSDVLDSFLIPSVTSSSEKEPIMEELYSYSVSILSDPGEDEVDWRMQAIALEIVSFTAQKMGDTFRPDLVDTLYPIVQLFGSSNANLREHAITSLNIISSACGYTNTSELIIQNVDYLVNSISLKLNTFDISPQAPQVLVMMIRLSGPSLIPYLDDVVGSIFAALENFHGYAKLVDSLFSVLGEIVEESVNSGQLKMIAAKDSPHRKRKPTAIKITDIVVLLEKSRRKQIVRENEEHEDFPQKPWKDAKTLLDEAETAKKGEGEEEAGAEPEVEPDSSAVEKTPPTKTYSMVQSIARLGQHYLTSQSPILRRRLLGLIGKACGALCSNEDDFLPLVNDIWPVLVKRLYDEEPYVVIAASETVANVCRCAGDFMSTRIQGEWQNLLKRARQVQKMAQAEKSGRHGRGVYSQNWQVWESFISLLTTIVEYVRIEDDMFDDVLELLTDVIISRDEVRDALSTVNADAVWLLGVNNGQELGRPVPIVKGYKFADLEI